MAAVANAKRCSKSRVWRSSTHARLDEVLAEVDVEPGNGR